MTLNEIKEQFKPGDRWKVTVYQPGLTVHGNLRTVPIAPSTSVTERQVHSVHSYGLLWEPDPETQKQRRTEWPKHTEILEARPGYLRFEYGGVSGNTVTLEQL